MIPIISPRGQVLAFVQGEKYPEIQRGFYDLRVAHAERSYGQNNRVEFSIRKPIEPPEFGKIEEIKDEILIRMVVNSYPIYENNSRNEPIYTDRDIYVIRWPDKDLDFNPSDFEGVIDFRAHLGVPVGI